MVKILNRSGGLLAEYDVENIRDADLSYADLRGADLGGADLRGANLTGADLRGAYLRGTDLRGADLGGADLTGTDLRDAILRGADLTGAYLTRVDLTGANLTRVDLTGANLIVITWMYWTVYITTDHIRIGCRSYTLEEWKKFSEEEISEMHEGALNFWKENKELIIGLCERLEKK